MFDTDYVHVKPLLDNLAADIGREKKRKVAELIICNADVFSRHEYDLGVTLWLHTTLIQIAIRRLRSPFVATPKFIWMSLVIRLVVW